MNIITCKYCNKEISKDKYLVENEYDVLRLWESDIKKDVVRCLQSIL